jgi:hypothetical protein
MGCRPPATIPPVRHGPAGRMPAAVPDLLVPEPDDDDDFAQAVANKARCFMAVAELAGEVVGYVDASWHEPDEVTELVRP